MTYQDRSPEAIRAARKILENVHFQDDQKQISHKANAEFLDRRAFELAPIIDAEFRRLHDGVKGEAHV